MRRAHFALEIPRAATRPTLCRKTCLQGSAEYVMRTHTKIFDENCIITFVLDY